MAVVALRGSYLCHATVVSVGAGNAAQKDVELGTDCVQGDRHVGVLGSVERIGQPANRRHDFVDGMCGIHRGCSRPTNTSSLALALVPFLLFAAVEFVSFATFANLPHVHRIYVGVV